MFGDNFETEVGGGLISLKEKGIFKDTANRCPLFRLSESRPGNNMQSAEKVTHPEQNSGLACPSEVPVFIH